MFHPQQIAPLANALGLTDQELFDRHLSVSFKDTTCGRRIFFLRPKGALRAVADADGGRCHWFKNGKCAVHRKGKPAACAFSMHDTPKQERRDYMLLLINAWAEHQDMIERLRQRPSIRPHMSGPNPFQTVLENQKAAE